MHIAGVVHIDLPAERHRDISLTPQFAAHKREVLSLLHALSTPLAAAH
jgi:hypothetical protein